MFIGVKVFKRSLEICKNEILINFGKERADSIFKNQKPNKMKP